MWCWWCCCDLRQKSSRSFNRVLEDQATSASAATEQEIVKELQARARSPEELHCAKNHLGLDRLEVGEKLDRRSEVHLKNQLCSWEHFDDAGAVR